MANNGGKANNKRIFAIIGAVVVVFFIIILLKSPTTTNSSGSDAPASKAIINQITSVPNSVSSSVGGGSVTVSASTISGKPYQTSGGLPNILYMGAEYCPYCATERWPMIIALSKFGTFSNLQTTHSSSSDVYPNTQTFSFHGSSFTSKYIGFTPVEMFSNIPSGNGYTTLDTATSTEQSLMNTYDAPPYTTSSNQGAIPFIYFAGKYLVVGATYSPQVLQGQSYQSIANALSNPKSSTDKSIAKGVLGAANSMTAIVCKLTNNQPATACTPTIKNMEASI
ncbi:MAG TPA: DUF929 family protein [Candidatus Saccharimonadales bacterium]